MKTINKKNEIMDILHISEVMTDMNIGAWIIELPKYNKPKMYGDTTMYTILGKDANTLTPENLYEYWISKIDPKHINLVMKTVESLKQGKSSEVKYLWQHPQKGWIWVRCGGYLDETYQDGFRFKGWHHDVTNELELDSMDVRYNIVNPKKLKLYSPYIIENIEELFEIDVASLNVNTIFYNKNKYHQFKEEKDIHYIINEQIHSDYINPLIDLFKPSSLQKIITEKQSKQLECKIKTITGEYCWVEAKILPINDVRNDKLLLCISNLSDKKRIMDLINEKNEIIDAFYNIYSSIAEIDLDTEQAYILKSDIEDFNEKNISIKQLYYAIIKHYTVDLEKETLKKFFDINKLKDITKKQDNYSLDFQIKEDNQELKWKRIETLYVPINKNKLYIAFSDVDDKHIMDSILKYFVFSNNDYLYYVDLKTNSFLNFCKDDENLLLPPQRGNDYINAMISYNKKYIILKDQDRIINMMKPEYIIKQLQDKDSYKIESGIIDDDGNYKRKLVTIQNYDRKNQTIFIMRKDITKEYFKQKNHQESLATAYKMANTDTLTHLYNRKGAYREIEKRLLSINDEIDAFIIIDLDNFKAINDSLGHVIGDELLQKVAHILKENFRKTDIIARLGGDEFIIYMKDIKNKEIVIHSIEKILNKLQLSYPYKNETIYLSASIGIAIAPIDGISFEDLYLKSDKALYNIKRQNKNGYRFYATNTDILY